MYVCVYTGCFGQLLGLLAFVAFLTAGGVLGQGISGADLKGENYWIASVWGWMTWKWSFQLFWWSRIYRRSIANGGNGALKCVRAQWIRRREFTVLQIQRDHHRQRVHHPTSTIKMTTIHQYQLADTLICMITFYHCSQDTHHKLQLKCSPSKSQYFIQ
jgi:hypothetical protein